MSPDTAPQAPAPKSRRWLFVGLGASLVVNMLLIGLFVGARLHHGGRHDFKGPHSEFMRSLPAERRNELRKDLEALRAGIHESRETSRALRAAAREVILKEPFDRAAVTAAVIAVGAAKMEAGRAAAERFVDLLSRMTVEERKTFLNLLDRRRGRFRDRGDREDM